MKPSVASKNPHQFCMVTPRELDQLALGVPLPVREYPKAVQGCTEEAEAALLRGQKTASACRLVYSDILISSEASL